MALLTHTFPPDHTFEIVQGDITAQDVDAIVNAANARLMHGGGVAGAIARKAGPALEEESRAWVRQHGPVTPENPACTTAGSLPCRYVIHAVGPVWRGGTRGEDEALQTAVRASLRRAAELGLHSLALPAISTGIFGFPMQRAARLTLSAIAAYFARYPDSPLALVRLVLYDRRAAETFLDAWRALNPA